MKHDAWKLASSLLCGLIFVWIPPIVLSQPAISVSVDVAQHSATAAELHVCPSGCDYSSIQAAVDAADSGDTIKVATGVYADTHVRPRADITMAGVVTQIVYISKTVTLQGGYSTANWIVSHPFTQPSILDANGKGRVVYVTGAISPVLEGLNITGGNADAMNGPWYDSVGSGIYAISATITVSASQVYGNDGADKGAGIGLRHGSILLSENVISGNTSYQYGGGLFLYNSESVLKNNTISENTGFCCAGGGVYLQYSNAMLIANVISNNWAGYAGGGVEIEGGAAKLTNNIISDNTAWIFGHFGSHGGGIRSTNAKLELVHNTFARNVGDEGISVNGGQATLINTIIVRHTTGISISPSTGSTSTLEATLWGRDAWANALLDYSVDPSVVVSRNVWGNPDFADPATGNYHVGPNSAALNWGMQTDVTEDIDSDPRPDGCGFDVGADELRTGVICDRHIYLVLVLKN